MEISNEIPDSLVPRYLGDNCEVDVYNEKKVRVRKLRICWLIACVSLRVTVPGVLKTSEE